MELAETELEWKTDIEVKRGLELPKKNVLVLCGFARAGKDSIADIVMRIHAVPKRAFADAVRAFAEAKNDFLPEAGKRYLEILKDEGGYENAKKKYPCIREHLVGIGHAARLEIHPNVWLNKLLPKPKHAEWDGSNWKGPDGEELPLSVCIVDARYENEVLRALEYPTECWELMNEYKVSAWYVDRFGIGPANETEAESVPKARKRCLHEIKNDGTLEDLEKKVLSLYAECFGV